MDAAGPVVVQPMVYSASKSMSVKKHILFVEDNALMTQLFVMMMEGERADWDVATAANGQQALQLMEKSPFEVVVSDMSMPGMTGAEFINEVRIRHPQSLHCTSRS
jgi:CheY-like chemotaxis protein